ncbi:hypothetical protein QYE76_011371 [Lolium multiflorum]|uniref:Uncharacterized protein n=1 Tax=Lolium multiflorum TaxID=4521 RepID=A0AAD8TZ03_LOLMU|nr:hypothetical protein QYE76_011371 [Lolium multiflorum]
MKASSAVGPLTPTPPSTSHAAPQPSPPKAHTSPTPATDAQVEVIPEQQALHYELHKNIALQCHVTLNQADKIHVAKEKNAELERQLAEAQGASSSLATASSELENLRSSYKDLETKLMEAEQKREHAEKQLAEKNSELIKKEGDFAMKRKVDSDTLQKLQKENSGLIRLQRIDNFLCSMLHY